MNGNLRFLSKIASVTGLEIEDSHFTSFPEFVNDKQTKMPSHKNENYPSPPIMLNGKSLIPYGNTATKPQDPALPKEKMTPCH